jgi:hypothetical protein
MFSELSYTYEVGEIKRKEREKRRIIRKKKRYYLVGSVKQNFVSLLKI